MKTGNLAPVLVVVAWRHVRRRVFARHDARVGEHAITTDSNGLVAGEVKIPVEGGEIPAYRAMPASGGPFPTVLVVHEIYRRPRTYQGYLPTPGEDGAIRRRAVALCARR